MPENPAAPSLSWDLAVPAWPLLPVSGQSLPWWGDSQTCLPAADYWAGAPAPYMSSQSSLGPRSISGVSPVRGIATSALRMLSLRSLPWEEFQLLRLQSWGRCLTDEAFELLIHFVLRLVSVVTQRKNYKSLRKYSAMEYPMYLIRKQRTFSIRGPRESILGFVGPRSLGLCCKASVPLRKAARGCQSRRRGCLLIERGLQKHDRHPAPGRHWLTPYYAGGQSG